MSYPDGSLQKYFDDHSWREKTVEKNPLPVRLIWAFIPHIDAIHKSLISTSCTEGDASNHEPIPLFRFELNKGLFASQTA